MASITSPWMRSSSERRRVSTVTGGCATERSTTGTTSCDAAGAGAATIVSFGARDCAAESSATITPGLLADFSWVSSDSFIANAVAVTAASAATNAALRIFVGFLMRDLLDCVDEIVRSRRRGRVSRNFRHK
jgi:hypothetical protein